MKILTIMSMKSSINKVSSIRVLFFIFPIFTKIECWPIFKQNPASCFLKMFATLFFLLLWDLTFGETLLDMSHDLAKDSIRWPTSPPFNIANATAFGYQKNGYW